jgi:cytoplasmic iron level regulating protein YaaA (DUF328/UPF0246 family)
MRIKYGTDKVRIKIEKFCLDSVSDTAVYEDLLNNKKVNIIRDEFMYDKNGKAHVTVWYSVPQ